MLTTNQRTRRRGDDTHPWVSIRLHLVGDPHAGVPRRPLQASGTLAV